MKKIKIKYKVVPSKKSEGSYNVQCQVVFNSTNTKFFTHFFKKSINFSEEFVNSSAFEETQKLYADYLEKIVRFEDSRVGDAYKMSGLNNRLSFYDSFLTYEYNHKVEQEVLSVLKDNLTYNQYTQIEGLGQPIGISSSLDLPGTLSFIEQEFSLDLFSLIGAQQRKVVLAGILLGLYDYWFKRSGKNLLHGLEYRRENKLTVGDWYVQDTERALVQFLQDSLPNDEFEQVIDQHAFEYGRKQIAAYEEAFTHQELVTTLAIFMRSRFPLERIGL